MARFSISKDAAAAANRLRENRVLIGLPLDSIKPAAGRVRHAVDYWLVFDWLVARHKSAAAYIRTSEDKNEPTPRLAKMAARPVQFYGKP
jgi:hypothetical protein